MLKTYLMTRAVFIENILQHTEHTLVTFVLRKTSQLNYQLTLCSVLESQPEGFTISDKNAGVHQTFHQVCDERKASNKTQASHG